jgi:hypothetical protein
VDAVSRRHFARGVDFHWGGMFSWVRSSYLRSFSKNTCSHRLLRLPRLPRTQINNLARGLQHIRPQAFHSCFALAVANIPTTVEDIGEKAFQHCISIETITLPEGMSKVRAYVFNGCTRLTTVKLPTTIAYIRENAFDGCRFLASIIFPSQLANARCEVGQKINTFKNIARCNQCHPLHIYIYMMS